jgi:hypothetical protein
MCWLPILERLLPAKGKQLNRFLSITVATAILAPVMATLASGLALAQGALPDPARTPGAVNSEVTQETIGATICVRGWTRTIRPPAQYTSALKRQQIRAWGYENQRMTEYEEDHLIPLGIGGAPYDEDNLWPQPLVTADSWDAVHKDRLESVLNRLVCSGRLSLAEAQAAIADDWTVAYVRYVLGE